MAGRTTNHKARIGFWEKIRSEALKDYDAIFGTSYRLWVINTSAEPRLYLWDTYQKLYPALNSLLGLIDEEAYIRTYQSFELEPKWLGFGRMKWTEENNKKWTSKYRTAEFKNKNLKFFNTEIWAPDWNSCISMGIGPKVFINIYSHPTIHEIREGILVACPRRMAMKYQDVINGHIDSLRLEIMHSKISAVDRKWTPGKRFVNRIEDMTPHELKKIIGKEG